MTLSHIIKVLLCIAALPLLSACNSKLTHANLEKITSGMTKTEVEAVLGTPDNVTTQDIPLLSTSEYHYKQGNSEVNIIFINDKVVSKNSNISK